VPSWDEWYGARVPEPCLVGRDREGLVLGWAALSPVSARAVYSGVGAVSIYVDPELARRGVGRALLSELVVASELAGFWTLEAGIFPENVASVALHEGCGFELVGTRRWVGRQQDGRWRDVALYERRSRVVGQD
jgi:L-amino acid N-acyltransferase YncA